MEARNLEQVMEPKAFWLLVTETLKLLNKRGMSRNPIQEVQPDLGGAGTGES